MTTKRSPAFTFVLQRWSMFDWDVLSSWSVKQAKRYFRELAFAKLSKDTVAEAVSVLLQNSTEARIAVHLTLFLHSSHSDVAEMVEMEPLWPIATCLGSMSISEDDYGFLVAKLGLDSEFSYCPPANEQVIAPAENFLKQGATDNIDPLPAERSDDFDWSIIPDEWRTRRSELVKIMYPSGINDRYSSKGDQSRIIGSLCMRARSFATITGVEHQKFLDQVYLSALKSPLLTALAMINTSIRIKNCFLLHELRDFLDLNIGQILANEKQDAETRLLEFALFKLLQELDDTSPFWHFYFSGLAILVDQDFIKLPDLLRLLKEVGNDFAKTNNLLNLTNIVKLFSSVLKPGLTNNQVGIDELVGYDSFIRILQYTTYMTDKCSTVLKLRQACIVLRQLIAGQLGNDAELKRNGDDYNLQSRSILELGLLFVRFPAIRDAVQEKLEEKAEDLTSKNSQALHELARDVTSLINSTCRVEWEGVAKFIQVLCRLNMIPDYPDS